MLKVLKTKIPYIIPFLLFYIVFELLTYHFVGMNGIAKYFLLDLFIVLFITSFIYLFKSNKVTIIMYSIFMFFFMILFLVNAHIYSIFGGIFSIEYLKVLGEANRVFSFSFLNFNIIMIALFIYSLYIITNYFIYSLTKNYVYNEEKDYIVNGMFLLVLTSLIFGILFSFNLKYADDNIYLNGKKLNDKSYVQTVTKSAFKHYGMLSLFYKEIEVDKKSSRNIIVSNNYLSNSNYEGLLKNKNVITIMGESLQSFAICEELTPNLYMLQNEGVNFSRNYSVNKTNVSEMIGITGGNYPFYDAEYNVSFSIPNLLNEDYVTTYVHDNNDIFYGRGNLTRFYGFEKTFFHDDLYEENFTNNIYPYGLPGWENNDWHWSGDYTLDSVTMDLALPYLVGSKNFKFYSFYTSLSMHGPYDGGKRSNLELFKKLGYMQKVEDAMDNNKWHNPLKGVSKYEDYLKYYECAVMDFDKAIGKLIKELKKYDLFDDTLLVIYGDHHVYYHDIYLKMANTTDISQVDKLYQTTLIMYNKTLNERFYNDNNSHDCTKFTSPFIVVPTILDLLGVGFNKDCYINYSVFDERYLEVFYSFQQKAFMNDYFYSEDLTNLRYVRDNTVSSKKFFEDANILRERIDYTIILYEKTLVEDET